jgi:hypothetical protein
MKFRHLVLLPAVGAMACHDGAPLAPMVQPASPVQAKVDGAYRVAVEQRAGTEAGTLTYVVRVLATGEKLGAYQGSVNFAPGMFDLVRVETPPNADGEYHVVNPAGFAEGRIRFAAFSTGTFSATEALRVTVRPRKAGASMAVSGVFEAGGTAAGAGIVVKEAD